MSLSLPLHSLFTPLSLLLVLVLSSCQERRAIDDQGKTSACWVYAMLTCIEHESAMRGDSVQLSRQWLVARELEEQTEKAYFGYQSGRVNHHSLISCRGVGPEVLQLIDRYGLVPYQNEKTEITKSSVLERKLSLLAGQAKSLEELREREKELLPQFSITSRNGAFYYFSQRYTPHQFAESIMYCQRWRFYASVPYHTYGETFALEVPDNYNDHGYINMPMDSIETKVLASLRAGHAVYWEYGRRTNDGLVTSDHAMAIVGIRNNKLLCRNSYGKDWGRHGYCLVSLDKFRKTTCNVGISQ